MPCKKMSIIFGVVDESLAESDFNHNRSYYQIYLKSTVRYTETVADYPITTMLAGMKYIECENSAVDQAAFERKPQLFWPRSGLKP